jgi:hypothetical protein
VSVRTTCPACGCQADIEAFLVEDEAKRLASRVAGMEPVLGRASLAYLRLFKPPRTALRLSRAVTLIEDLIALVESGTVSRDDRSQARRATTAAMWAAGIETMLASPPPDLPLPNHNYLRSVVFRIAEEGGSALHTSRPAPTAIGPSPIKPPEDPMLNAVRYANQMMDVGGWDQQQRDEYIAEQQAKLESKP